MLVDWGRSFARVALGAWGGGIGFGCLTRAVLSKGRVSMICLSASLTICSKVGRSSFRDARSSFFSFFY